MLSTHGAEHLLDDNVLRSGETANDRCDLRDAVLNGVLQHAAWAEDNRGYNGENDHDDDPLDHLCALLVFHIAGHLAQHDILLWYAARGLGTM